MLELLDLVGQRPLLGPERPGRAALTEQWVANVAERDYLAACEGLTHDLP